MSERAWMAWAGTDPEEFAVAVFATDRQAAKLMAYRAILGLTFCSYTDVRLRLLSGDCEHLRAQPGPHVNVSPPSCERCETWRAEPLVNGVCVGCLVEEEDEWLTEA